MQTLFRMKTQNLACSRFRSATRTCVIRCEKMLDRDAPRSLKPPARWLEVALLRALWDLRPCFGRDLLRILVSVIHELTITEVKSVASRTKLMNGLLSTSTMFCAPIRRLRPNARQPVRGNLR